MIHKIIFAGFGGQGVLFAGKTLAYAGMDEDLQISWLPSYGPEMRGGTANCSVIISDEPIGSPVINAPDVLIAMNKPSLEKFENDVVAGGTIIYDSSLIDRKVERDDVTAAYVEATKLASDAGKRNLANMVMLGALIKATGVFTLDEIRAAVEKTTPPAKQHLVELNMQMIEMGYNG